jgi:hypothetical protein
MILDAILRAARGSPSTDSDRLLASIVKQAAQKPRLDPDQWQVFLESGLVRAVIKIGAREVLGQQIPTWQAIQDYEPGEYGRLFSKGQTLYEHCMVEESHACVIGFFDHELQKSRRAERVVLDLLGWMKRFRDLHQSESHAGGFRRRMHTDVMLDHGVSYLYGLDRESATRLAEDKEPTE